MAQATVAAERTRPSTWRTPIVLVVIGLPPLIAGVVRLVQVLGGADGMDADRRFEDFPAPLVVHVVAVLVYALLGATQFSAELRRRHLPWHRVIGRISLVAAFGVSLSAYWMTFAYPFKPGTGPLLFMTRLAVASAMTVALVAAYIAIRDRRVQDHRAWMVRAYALGLGAATQMFTLGFGEPVLGDGEIAHDLLMAAGWGINAFVAERIIRRSSATKPGRAATTSAVGYGT